MKLGTNVVIGLRNVGKPEDQAVSEVIPMSEGLKWLTVQLSKVTMAKRIEVVIGRNAEDIRRSWEPYKQGQSSDSIDDELAAIMAEHGIDGEL